MGDVAIFQRWERGVLIECPPSSFETTRDVCFYFLRSDRYFFNCAAGEPAGKSSAVLFFFFLETPLLQVTPVDREPILNKILTLRIKMYGNRGTSAVLDDDVGGNLKPQLIQIHAGTRPRSPGFSHSLQHLQRAVITTNITPGFPVGWCQ